MGKQIVYVATIFGAAVVLTSFVGIRQNEPWSVPDKYEKMENPLKGDKESISIGKSLYRKHCRSCHGDEGLGDGPKSAELDTHCGDFTASTFQAQSDGAIFYKTFEGRGDMPGYSKKIPDEEDIWSIVNYVRTLK